MMKLNQLFSLDKKTALVIGGCSRIGRSISESLAEAGATVFISSRDYKKAQETVEDLYASTENVNFHAISVDQTSEVSLQEALKIISSKVSAPTILVNCAVERPMKTFLDDPYEAFDRSLVVNGRGLFLACRTFGQEMVKKGEGSIINISSIYGTVVPDMKIYEGTNLQTTPDYPFVKGGMVMLSKYFASLWAQSNVRVNVIAPGGVFNQQPEPFLTRYCSKVPMGRMAHVEDVKGSVVFLASQASSYITGMVIPLDGGFTII